MKKQIIILVLVIFSTFSMAATHLRTGIRGGGLSLGIDTTSSLTQDWSFGYGASIHPVDNTVGVFISFTNHLGNQTQSNPAYISFGPVAYVGNSGIMGAFFNLGWVRIFNTEDLELEAGLEVLNTRSELNIELLYQL